MGQTHEKFESSHKLPMRLIFAYSGLNRCQEPLFIECLPNKRNLAPKRAAWAVARDYSLASRSETPNHVRSRRWPRNGREEYEHSLNCRHTLLRIDNCTQNGTRLVDLMALGELLGLNELFSKICRHGVVCDAKEHLIHKTWTTEGCRWEWKSEELEICPIVWAIWKKASNSNGTFWQWSIGNEVWLEIWTHSIG